MLRIRLYLILVVITVLFGNSSYCNEDQDSLVNVIRYSKSDSITMLTEAELAKSIYLKNVDSAINSMRRALIIAQSNGYEFNKGLYLKEIGVFYYSISSYNLALDYLREAHTVFKNIKEGVEIADVSYYMGVCYNETGNYNLSIDYFYQALEVYEKNEEMVGVGRTLNSIGINLEAMGEDESAYKLYKKAFKFKKEAKDYNGMASGYISFGNIKLKMGQIDSSLFYHRLALQAANLLNNNRVLIDSYYCLGNDNLELKNADEAIKYFKSALENFVDYRNDYQMSEVYNGLAKAYFLKGDAIQALKYVKSNISNLKNSGATSLLKNSYLLMAEIRNSTGDFDKAFEAMKEYALMKDSIYNSEKLTAVAEMQEKYKADQKQKEIDVLKYNNEISSLKNYKQKAFLIGFIIFSVIVLIFLVIVIVMYKARVKTNLLLKQSVKDKEVLLKEVHHRVKNNFQLISSLLNLQSDLVEDQEALIAINESRNRIASMALVHKNLYLAENLTRIEMQNYIDQLLDNILSSADNKGVTISYNLVAKDIRFDVDTSVPLGLIINELLSNSIKYAFTDRNEGEISLNLRQIEGSKYELIYSDNGIGIPEDIDLDNLTSLGLELVQLLVAQLNGSVNFEVNGGTRFKIIFNKV